MTEAHRLLMAVVGGHEYRPLLAGISGLPRVDGVHDPLDVLAGVHDSGGVLRRSAAGRVARFIDGDLVGEDEGRVGRCSGDNPCDGRVNDLVVGLLPRGVECHELIDVGRVATGAGHVVDVFPVGVDRGVDLGPVVLDQVEHRRPGVIRRGVEDVVDDATLVVPHAGQDGGPRRAGDGGVADDARRAGDTLLHDRTEPAVGLDVGVLQHLVQVRAVGADQ